MFFAFFPALTCVPMVQKQWWVKLETPHCIHSHCIPHCHTLKKQKPETKNFHLNALDKEVKKHFFNKVLALVRIISVYYDKMENMLETLFCCHIEDITIVYRESICVIRVAS